MKLPLWPLVALPLSTALVFPFHHNPLLKDDDSISVDDENIDSNIDPSLIEGITTTLTTALDHLTTDIWRTIVDNSFMYSPGSLHYHAQQVSELAPPFRHPSPPPFHRHPASNKTLYNLILSNPDTAILAHFIRNDPHLTNLLNNTSADLTFFAPTDKAIRKFHHHHHHEPNTNNKDASAIRHILTYHIVTGSYPADRLFHSPTVPTFITTEHNPNSLPQRITVRPIKSSNLILNFHSRIISLDKRASNGILYHIDSVLLPPPSALTLLNILPSEFSTFTQALYKTGLDRILNTSSITRRSLRSLNKALNIQDNDRTQIPKSSTQEKEKGRRGGGLTIFLPTNPAFTATFTPQALAFLFSSSPSSKGSKYLSALMKYHIVIGETLYSDYLYTKHGDIIPLSPRDISHLEMESLLSPRMKIPHHHEYEYDTNTAINVDINILSKDGDEKQTTANSDDNINRGKNLLIDAIRHGAYLSLRVTGYHQCSIKMLDLLTAEGNMHVLTERVLVPPRRVGGGGDARERDGGLIGVEELRERLDEFIEEGEHEGDDEYYTRGEGEEDHRFVI
ncbi:hypothetical protein AbraIFM66951_008559 [Aspergillus brasiliensis]|uniref:FAS1 domain-containing protein n=1 Tax=Aspergillus brasiliensis TaxID=319629 RepID=A0A9W5YF16_9EURO|nr:hypothetical protein AbraCBS73388_004161 [Aspergillus brasiliensis]GKZ41166.1 hypothetical protein AbraIFM66951_008559 [Aspergillus brasiliensis]